MYFLLLIPLLILHLDGRFTNSPLVHLADSLRIKCDALPYRTTYVGTRCYFALTEELKMDDATSKCHSIFSGAKISTNAPTPVFTAMMIDNSKFHVAKDSSSKSSKQAICFFDSNYKCEEGEPSSLMPGKCIDFHDKKANYPEAVKYCAKRGMEVLAINNDLENRMIRVERSRALLKEPVWIRNVYQGEINRKWNRTSSFSRYSTCARPSPRLYASSEIVGTFCPNPWGVSSALDSTGYWGTTAQGEWLDAMCVKNAVNDFNRGTIKIRKPKTKEICTPLHEFDEDSGLCEWTGPKDVCMQTIDIYNRTGNVRMPYFPLQTWKGVLYNEGVFANDLVNKVIVRRGCVYTGYQGWSEKYREVSAGNENVGYGEHAVPGTSTLAGLTMVRCMCDPTEATLNDHPLPPPPKDKCIEHHEFNKETQQCEWIRDPKYCGQLITFDGRKQFIEIPNWPKNKKYDVNHWDEKKSENFHIQVTQIIVRQHCWATIMPGSVYQSFEQRTRHLELSGYGKHQVKSHYNGQLENPNDGPRRIICQCIDTENEAAKDKKKCIANHEWDEETGMCEWTGPKDACLQTVDAYNKKGYMILPYFPLQTADEINFSEGVFVNDLVNKVIVRRGCAFTGFPGWSEKYREVSAGNENVGYGEYTVPGTHTWDGLSLIWCTCDPTQATLNDHAPPPRVPKPKPQCIEHHKFNEETQQCEWIHDPKYCAELITFDGRKQKIEIPNYPKNKKYDVNHFDEKKAENFHVTVTQVIVRQHCWVTMSPGAVVEYFLKYNRLLQTVGYGKHEIRSHYNGWFENPNDGYRRIMCECIH